METRGRVKIRRTSVETEPRPRHERPCLETVSRQETCLETPSLQITERTMRVNDVSDTDVIT